MLAYKCKHCKKITLWGCFNKYEEHFCDKKCYLDYCYSNGYEAHPEELSYIRGVFS